MEELNKSGIPLAQLDVAKVPASMAKPSPESIVSTKTYPTVEEMTFKGIVKSEEEAYALLRAVQILVNELGAETIIKVVGTVEKKPQLLQKAKTYLPYISML